MYETNCTAVKIAEREGVRVVYIGKPGLLTETRWGGGALHLKRRVPRKAN